MKLEDAEFYWLRAPAVDPQDPLKIGEFCAKGLTKRNTDQWCIDGKFYNNGPGIEPISHIKKPDWNQSY